MVTREDHSRFINYIVDNPFLIGEKGHLDWVLKEGTWKVRDNHWNEMPDLILRYDSTHYVLCELKHSYERREKAIRQINSGADFLAQCMHVMFKPRGVVAYYSENFESLQYEDVLVTGGFLNVGSYHRWKH